MSNNYAQLYGARKDLLQNTITKLPMVDATKEIEKRSQSPMPVSRNTLVPLNDSTKKVVYHHQLDDLKKDISKQTESSHQSLLNEVSNKLALMQKTIDDYSSKIDMSRNDKLKGAIEDLTKQTNANVSKLASTVSDHNDKLLSIESRVTNVENIM